MQPQKSAKIIPLAEADVEINGIIRDWKATVSKTSILIMMSVFNVFISS